MRAMLCDRFGGIDQSDVSATCAPPVIAADHDVLIEVAAAGVNFADTLMIGGTYQEKPPLPFSPGLEIAGIVRSVAPRVRRVKPGDRVLAVVDRGGFAEQAVAQEADVFPIPADMDFITAAGFAIAYGTSHGALRWRADLQAGRGAAGPRRGRRRRLDRRRDRQGAWAPRSSPPRARTRSSRSPRHMAPIT